MSSTRSRLHHLFGGGGGGGRSSDKNTSTATGTGSTPNPPPAHHHIPPPKLPSHPPRTSDTRNIPAGLSLRSPSLRPAIEDKLQEELPDEVEFLSLDSPMYDEPGSLDDLDTIDEDDFRLDGIDDQYDEGGSGAAAAADPETDTDDDLKDWPDEEDTGSTTADQAVHIEGVPRSDSRMEAKQYKTQAFATSLLHLLRNELRIAGWRELPESTPTSQMSVHKVSGALTNAVFFISYPKPQVVEHLPASLQEQLPPTVLLRVYGPSSGNLISRQKELHVLNTLSAVYGIGPAILGTFRNGRVEEYFESRALYKEELRQPTISRWIARRMRELHSVDLAVMEYAPDSANAPYRPHSQKRGSSAGPGYDATSPQVRPAMPGQNVSSSSGLSTSSASSIQSVASSSWSSSSSIHSASTTSTFASPRLTARSSSKPGVSEGPAPRKKRSTSSFGSKTPNSLNNGGAAFSLEYSKRTGKKPKSSIWVNVEDWTREAKKVLRRMDKLDELIKRNGFATSREASAPSSSLEATSEDGRRVITFLEDVNPLMSPTMLKDCIEVLDTPRFAKEWKKYRKFVEERERSRGKSKRVFAHNDTQCGNLLRLTPGGRDELVPGLRAAHEMIIVVDFEYAGVNPRAFDIANHFLEWQTDYHHPTLSHSVTKHGTGPTLEERQRFYRAYIPCDGGYDDSIALASGRPVVKPEPTIPPLAQDDVRVQRLEEEVQLWTAASHAMYFVWSIVQATDDIARTIDAWLADPAAAKKADEEAYELKMRLQSQPKPGPQEEGGQTKYNNNAEADVRHAAKGGRPAVMRGKSGEEIHLYDEHKTTTTAQHQSEASSGTASDQHTPPASQASSFHQETPPASNATAAPKHAAPSSTASESTGKDDGDAAANIPPASSISPLGDFDYLSYAYERASLFRAELDKFQIR